MAATEKRIAWIDIVKYVCIMFVMMDHIGYDKLVCPAPMINFFTPFFLSGFLFASGYVSRCKGRSFRLFLGKKVRQLLIPWLLFSLLQIAASYIYSVNPSGHVSIFQEIGRNFLQVRSYGDHMWFIAALFVAFIPFYFIVNAVERYREHHKNADRVFLCCACACYLFYVLYNLLMPKTLFPWNSAKLPWHLEYVPYALSFMMTGYWFRGKGESAFDRVNTIWLRIGLLLFYCLLIGFPHLPGISLNVYTTYLWNAVCSVIGIGCLISICKVIQPNKYLLFVGQNTLIYFGIHEKIADAVLLGIRLLFPSFMPLVLSNMAASAVFVILFDIVLSLLLIVPTWIIRRYFPFFIGNWYRKKTDAKKEKQEEIRV